MEQNQADLTELFCRMLARTVMILPFIAALLFLAAGARVFSYAVLNPAGPARDSVFHPLNDVLRALVILELLRTVSRFLKNRISSLRCFLPSAAFLHSGVSSW
jgi:uncharacterized membrane protein (DUF373 family)